ncbi:hypothetical protein Q4610_07165 [Sphingobium sp. HBC34]|uniref:Uncharacterized protein n=1 Tax=Sphingobium cyanobacteriorum TaxID=3063954 RepID=A0ABT8ZJV6_9SPHN|nr:hypothetical protein [Sphingobium sp. HBC34]MDO7834824.1 hypothetical protein [Sphingobium sp. HBC34]
MSCATLLGGSVAPVLLMLSPFAVMAAKDCDAWQPAAKAAKSASSTPGSRPGSSHCDRPRLPLM